MRNLKTYKLFIEDIEWTPLDHSVKVTRKDLNRYINFFENELMDKKKSYIVGNRYKIQDSEFNKIKEILKKDCSHFLNELKSDGDFLFRGMKTLPDNTYNDIDGIWIKQARKNRTPRDLDYDIDMVFNDLFKERFNIPLRRQGVFATKDPIGAKGYTPNGEAYLFFPIDDYKYFWNPEITDLYNYLDDQEWYNDFESEKSLEDISFYDYHKKKAKLDGYDPMDEIEHIVNDYKKGGLSEVGVQEITFILDKYYVIHEKYYFKLKEWLNE